MGEIPPEGIHSYPRGKNIIKNESSPVCDETIYAPLRTSVRGKPKYLSRETGDMLIQFLNYKMKKLICHKKGIFWGSKQQKRDSVFLEFKKKR